MTLPQQLGTSSTDGIVSTNDNEKPRPKKCACATTREVAVLHPSMYIYKPTAVRPFDAQSDKHTAVDGGVAA